MQLKKYLYTLVYDKHETALSKLESNFLFNEEDVNKLLSSDIKVAPSSSSFIKSRLDILSTAEDYTALINKIKKETINDLEVYTAEISRDSLTLKTAWWYDDGQQQQTTEEWNWRWRSLLHQERYYLVNVSVPMAGNLKQAIEEVREK